MQCGKYGIKVGKHSSAEMGLYMCLYLQMFGLRLVKSATIKVQYIAFLKMQGA